MKTLLGVFRFSCGMIAQNAKIRQEATDYSQMISSLHLANRRQTQPRGAGSPILPVDKAANQ
jgi:hypothetical protein